MWNRLWTIKTPTKLTELRQPKTGSTGGGWASSAPGIYLCPSRLPITHAYPTKTGASNSLIQKFTGAAMNARWVADVTCLPTAEELSHPGDHRLDEPHRVLLRQRNLGAIFLFHEARMVETRIVRRSPGRKASASFAISIHFTIPSESGGRLTISQPPSSRCYMT